MKDSVTETMLVVVLICAVGYLIYLDWLRQGEIDFLAEEVSKMRAQQTDTKGAPDGTEA